VLVRWLCRTLSAQRQLCSLSLSNLHILLCSFNLLPVNLRTHLHVLIESVANLKVLGARGQTILRHELDLDYDRS